MGQDIIGDIHGHADALEALLSALGYANCRGAWRHPEGTAIFVGDLIDRGPAQLRTLRMVRDMVDAGAAEVVLGNHELNAIGWAHEAPDASGEFLRPRHGKAGAKNRAQHQAFLSEVGEDSAEHKFWVGWFFGLPLWIERPGYRVVHACWDQDAVDFARPFLTPSHQLIAGNLAFAFTRNHPLKQAIDTLLKGPELELPGGVTFTDKDGHVRSEIRTRWWDETARTYRQAYIGPDGVDVPDLLLPRAEGAKAPDRPTFIGHYWLDPSLTPAALSPTVACVDYSVAKGGPATAYRFDGEQTIRSDHFIRARGEGEIKLSSSKHRSDHALS